MSKLRVFVSSTYYDLRHLRRALQDFIEGFGFDAVLSERGDVAYSHDQSLDEACYQEVENCDIYVLVVGSRYGSPASTQQMPIRQDFYTPYDSVTRIEYETAAKNDKQIYVLVDTNVHSQFETWRLNKDNNTVKYATLIPSTRLDCWMIFTEATETTRSFSSVTFSMLESG